MFRAVQTLISQSRAEIRPGFLDLSDIFADSDSLVFIDFCHTTEKANATNRRGDRLAAPRSWESSDAEHPPRPREGPATGLTWPEPLGQSPSANSTRGSPLPVPPRSFLESEPIDARPEARSEPTMAVHGPSSP